MDSRFLTPREELELDIDLRLGTLMVEALADDVPRDQLAGLFRLAYGAGYTHALVEPLRAQLCRDHRLPVPRRARR